MRCWLSSSLAGMFCAMSSLDVLFFACHRLESTTLQPSKVDGLVDAVRGPPCGIYALLQYLPIFLSQFSAGLLRLLSGPDMWRVRSCARIADGKHSTSVQSLLLFSTFQWRIFQQTPQLLYITISLCPCWSLMTTISTAYVGILKLPCRFYSWRLLLHHIAHQNTAKVGKTVHIINVLPANSDSTSPTCITFVLLALIRSPSSLLPFPDL